MFPYFYYIKSNILQEVDSSVSGGKRTIFGFNDLLFFFPFPYLLLHFLHLKKYALTTAGPTSVFPDK